MKTLRSRVGVAVVNKKLYAFGGYDGSARLSTVECYDPQVSSLSTCACDILVPCFRLSSGSSSLP